MVYTYKFTRKHINSVKNNPMSGITLRAWLEVLWTHRRSIEWTTYWLRLLFLTTMAVLNTVLWAVEWALYAGRLRRTKVNPRPLFLLGHPRTGTTHLHNLLALDTEQFGVPSTFHVGFPSSFLFTQRYSWLLEPILDKTRPMDNVQLTFETPQEDELATNVRVVIPNRKQPPIPLPPFLSPSPRASLPPTSPPPAYTTLSTATATIALDALFLGRPTTLAARRRRLLFFSSVLEFVVVFLPPSFASFNHFLTCLYPLPLSLR